MTSVYYDDGDTSQRTAVVAAACRGCPYRPGVPFAWDGVRVPPPSRSGQSTTDFRRLPTRTDTICFNNMIWTKPYAYGRRRWTCTRYTHVVAHYNTASLRAVVFAREKPFLTIPLGLSTLPHPHTKKKIPSGTRRKLNRDDDKSVSIEARRTGLINVCRYVYAWNESPWPWQVRVAQCSWCFRPEGSHAFANPNDTNV